jgi:putative acetyltransferase
MKIHLETADQPEVIRLIAELDAYQMPLYPAESHHGIDLRALTQPNVLFAVMRDEDALAFGCGAVVIGPNYGELKRMFIRPAFRGQGASKILLSFLESAALNEGCRYFTLETGISQPEALGLYERCGYSRCEPFGDYKHDPFSVFMHKRIASGAKR